MAGSRRDQKIRRGLVAVQQRAEADNDGLYQLLESAKRTLTQVFHQVDPTQLKITSANDYYKIAVALSSLLKAQTEFERWQAERFGCILEAKDLLSNEIRRQIAGKPDLFIELSTVIEESKNLLIEQHGASPPPDAE